MTDRGVSSFCGLVEWSISAHAYLGTNAYTMVSANFTRLISMLQSFRPNFFAEGYLRTLPWSFSFCA